MSYSNHRFSSAADGKKTGDGTGVGFFIPVDQHLADAFPLDRGGDDASVPHVTFLYVGAVQKSREDELVSIASSVLSNWIRGPVRGNLDDQIYFDNPGKPRIAVMSIRFSHDLSGLRWRLRDALIDAGFQVDDSFPLVYRPHATLKYLEDGETRYTGPVPSGSWDFDGIEIWGMSEMQTIGFGGGSSRTARMVVDAMDQKVSVELMKFLSSVSKKLGVAEHVYVVGGAVRNFVIHEPIKDIDVVIDSVSLGGDKDSAWFANKLQSFIPARTNVSTNNYGVAILSIVGDWEIAGVNLRGEVIEIANARTESYAKDTYKPDAVAPATIVDDVYRREFTFNTLLWKMIDLADGPDKAGIIDLTGCGLNDLKDGVMRCPSDPDKTFSDDPSRMIRAIKFLLKYKFMIPPDVVSSIKRNKEKIRNIPGSHLSNMIISLFYETSVGKKALVKMDELGILDVVRSIAETDRPFREALANWAERKADVSFLFDLMDLGMPVGKSLGFLSGHQKDRVREITVDMTVDDGAAFVLSLEQPGKVINMPELIQEFGLKGSQIKDLMVVARSSLLDDPVLVASPRRWESRIRSEFSQRGKLAKTFTLNPGDPVLFGKFKNKRGIIRDFSVNDKNDPVMTVETPNGQVKEIGIFKIREPLAPPVVGLAGQIPGGLGDKSKPGDFDKVQVNKGKKVELEHTNDPGIAMDIVMDHLTEDPRYYDKLETVEKVAAIKYASRREWTDRVMPEIGEIHTWTTFGGDQHRGTVVDTDSNVLEVACTDGVTRVVEAKYKSKKTVKNKDGEDMVVYEYSDQQIANRNKEKAERIDKLRGNIDKLRSQYRKDLNSNDEKTLYSALAVGLMDVTFERVGNDDSADDGHFGVTGWMKKHFTINGNKATIKYVGKSGVSHVKEISDAAVMRVLKKTLDGKKDNDLVCEGDDTRVTSVDVNEYLKPFDITAKDIRGFHANDEMQTKLKEVRSKGGELPSDPKKREKKLKDEFNEALDSTAEAVGHESATLRSHYLVPGLEDDFMDDGKVNNSFVKKAEKTHAEDEDEEAQKMVRESPKLKPPRHDLRNNRMEHDSDPDMEDLGAEGDKDLSLNYKRVASLWMMRLSNDPPLSSPASVSQKIPSVDEQAPGTVVTTKNNLRAKNKGGEVEYFDLGEGKEAKAFATDGESSEVVEQKQPVKPDEQPKQVLDKKPVDTKPIVKALNGGSPKEIDKAVAAIKESNPEVSDKLDAYLSEYNTANKALSKAFVDLSKSVKNVDKDAANSAMVKAESDRNIAISKVTSIFDAPEKPKDQENPEKPAKPKDQENPEKPAKPKDQEKTEKPVKPKDQEKTKKPVKPKSPPVVIGGVAVSASGKSAAELISRSSKAYDEYNGMSDSNKEALVARILVSMSESDNENVTAELSRISDGINLASIVSSGKQASIGDGKGAKLLGGPISNQYAALAKALHKSGEGNEKLLLNLETDDRTDFYGPRGVEMVFNALNSVDDDSELLAIHGDDVHMTKALNNPKLPQDSKDEIRNLIKTTIAFNMTISHASIVAGRSGGSDPPSRRQISDVVKSGDMSAVNVKYINRGGKEFDIDPSGVAEIRSYASGQYEVDIGDIEGSINKAVQEARERSKEYEDALNSGDVDSAFAIGEGIKDRIVRKFDLTPSQKYAEFMSVASDEMKERMKGVSPDEFMDMIKFVTASH